MTVVYFLCYSIAMKMLVLYRPHSEYARRVEEFLHDMQQYHDVDQQSIQIVDVDSREGIALASMYDVMSGIGIIVTDNLGSYIKDWQGTELPLSSEVVAYLRG